MTSLLMDSNSNYHFDQPTTPSQNAITSPSTITVVEEFSVNLNDRDYELYQMRVGLFILDIVLFSGN